MTVSWATSLDLHLELSGPRVGRALEEALRGAVRDGRLPAGERLPSSRSLAADLGVARNTVAEVYAQLRAEGWLEARQGSGTTVAPCRRRPTMRQCPGTERIPSSATTFDPEPPTSPPFPVGTGSWRRATRWPRHRTTCSATATRAAPLRCVRHSPDTSPAHAA